jgi:putative oxidoreductase
MATQSGSIASRVPRYRDNSDAPRKTFLGPAAVLAGRLLFSLIFLLAAVGHFSHQEVAYAVQQGVPLASIAVPLSGMVALLGGLSVLVGYQAKWGAWLLILFLGPVTLLMHNFWVVKDPMMAQMQMAMFMKNLSMIGGALLITQFGAGPLSLDAHSSR